MQGVFDFYRNYPNRPQRPERLFFGLRADRSMSVRAGRLTEDLVRTNKLRGKPIKMERLHVSLHHVGDYRRLRDKFVYAARRAGETISVPPFEMAFRFAGSFDGGPLVGGRQRKWPLVLLGESDALREFHQVLGASMEKNGLRAAQHFLPHMTLLYGPDAISFQPIEPIRLMVYEFVLIHSERGLTRYNILGRWPLRR